MIYQYAINTANIVELSSINTFFDIISDKRKNKINRLCYVNDKIHSLMGEVILKYALWEQYNLDDKLIHFKYSEYGKPSLIGYENIFFNLSHSGNWVLCGVGDVPIGIDVEYVKKTDFSFSNRIYTDNEKKFLTTQSYEDKFTMLYKIWTLKESYVKCVGKGLAIPFKSISFRLFDDSVDFSINGELNDNFLFRVIQLDKVHIAALCVSSKEKNIVHNNIKNLDLEGLLMWKDLYRDF